MVVSWNGGRIRLVNPPRTLITRLSRGLVFGHPGESEKQKHVLKTALSLLERKAPLEPVYLHKE